MCNHLIAEVLAGKDNPYNLPEHYPYIKYCVKCGLVRWFVTEVQY